MNLPDRFRKTMFNATIPLTVVAGRTAIAELH